MKKILRFIKNIWYSLFWGMKTTEDTMLKGDTSTIPGSAIIQEVNDHRVSKALLKGELTQEVVELRYRTYKVDREAKEYEYIAPTLAFKREKNDSKFVSYENEDNLEIITIQPNDVNIENITDGLRDVDFAKATIINEQDDIRLDIGKYKSKHDYIIKLRRELIARYKLEEYTKRLVVKKHSKTLAILDFYVSKYPNDKDFKSKGFVREIEKIRDNGIRSDVLDIENVYFITNHAYKQVDMLEFEFKNLTFLKIVEFDGHYIVRFKAKIVKNGIDLTEQYYSKTMDEKYKNKVKKDVVLDVFGMPSVEKYVCEGCGKEIYYDPEGMDYMPINRPRDIDDEETNINNNTEFIDIQITQQTYGKALCKDCLKKYLANNKK